MANLPHYPQTHCQCPIKHYRPGAEHKWPSNIGKYDAIICKSLVIIAGPNIRVRCEEPMPIMKFINAGLGINARRKATCDAFSYHQIEYPQMFVAVCKNSHQHVSGQEHIVCSVCIENKHLFEEDQEALFSIARDYYKYKRKKRGLR